MTKDDLIRSIENIDIMGEKNLELYPIRENYNNLKGYPMFYSVHSNQYFIIAPSQVETDND